MKKSLLSVIVCLIMVGAPVFAHEVHEAHEHGKARLNLSVEGQKVEIEFETPLAGLISFEHAPETDAQKKELRDMATIMRNAGALFIFPAEALCRLENVSLESEALSDASLSPAGARGGEEKAAPRGDKKGNGESHADLDAEISFICRHPEKLDRIEVRMFKAFPGLEEIEMRMVTPKGQGAAELTPRANVVKW